MNTISILRLENPAWILFLIELSISGSCVAQESKIIKNLDAKDLFNARCLSAGEKINRTVEDVEGLFIIKLRPKSLNYGDQFKMDDPYGSDLTGKGYLRSFLRGSYDVKTMVPSYISHQSRGELPAGYSYVEAIDISDGKRHRYSGHIDEPWQKDKNFLKGYFRFILDDSISKGEQPQYGITYEDISTIEDREFWIAGSALKIVDLKNNEVIAERIGYMFDPGQGSRAGGRESWLIAADHACPSFGEFPGANSQAGQANKFAEKVLHPTN